MIKWIVCWYIVTTVSAGAPPAESDRYTSKMPMTQHALLYLQAKEQLMNRVFDSEEDALEFMDNAPDEIKEKMKLIQLEKIYFEANTFGREL